jgi:hypothetical protein
MVESIALLPSTLQEDSWFNSTDKAILLLLLLLLLLLAESTDWPVSAPGGDHCAQPPARGHL